MKIKLFLLLLIPISLIADDSSQFDLYVRNYTNHDLHMKMYPIGMVFNDLGHYSLIGKTIRTQVPWNLSSYINCDCWVNPYDPA